MQGPASLMKTTPLIDRLTLASPLYARLIAQDPSIVPWLETVADTPVSLSSLRRAWGAFATDGSLAQLRRFRRRISLLIACRSVNDLATERETTAELTRLAEFCLCEITAHALTLWKSRRGEPWDDDLNRPARFAVVAMGKMGGEELNFSSDIDLIYICEGDGRCRLGGRATEYTSIEFFTKVAGTITQELSAKTAEGFLFRVDTRLRPEGDAGPLVRSTLSLENYYAAAGQTWERLALLKARPVAGDLRIADELLETLQPFRYPRHPPPSLLAEIAAMKQRNQDAKTSACDDSRFNVKLGAGGIREIEFIAQSLQLLHAGRFPFLQTHSTQVALEHLAQYDLFPRRDAAFLIDAYWFLRRVEHRIQMREEAHSHTLPSRADELAAIAASLGFADAGTFLAKLDATRRRVRALYEDFFAPKNRDDEMEDWWTFFTTPQIPGAIGKRLDAWGGAAAPASSAPSSDLPEALRIFVCGDASHLVTREQVMHFRHLAGNLDPLMPALARPARALRRLARFASRYGTRNQFLNTCAANPRFLRVLALLFDRSAHACSLLCEHPEIIEEVLRAGGLRAQKDRAALRAEIAAGSADDEAFARWLALYIRAEQLRCVTADLPGVFETAAATPRGISQIESSLSLLADAAVESALARLPGGGRLLVVALGKYGGAELTFGSDLDMMFVADDAAAIPPLESAARRLAQVLRGDGASPAFAVDTRLRPHGEAGPQVTTLRSLREYHGGGGGAGPAAQAWERQMLTRARVVCGPAALGAAFLRWRDGLLFSAPIDSGEVAGIRAMRARVERERNVCEPPQRAFKTCAGGLVDFEFFVQTMQLLHGWKNEALRKSSTRALLAELRDSGVTDALMQNYDFLKRIEVAARRDENKPVSILPPPDSEGMEALARWLGFESAAAFWAEYTRRLRETREALDAQWHALTPG